MAETSLTTQGSTQPVESSRRSKKLIPWDSKQIEFLRQLKFPPDASRDEVIAALAKAATLGLDPLADEVWFVRYDRNLVTQVSIHGMTRKAEESGHFRGYGVKKLVISRQGSTPIQVEEWEYDPDGGDRLIAAMAGARRDEDDPRDAPAPYVARFNEYVGKNKQGEVTRRWRQAPATQLMKCAKAGTLRERFSLGSIYIREELDRNEAITVQSREVGYFDPSTAAEFPAAGIREEDLSPSDAENRGHGNEQLDKLSQPSEPEPPAELKPKKAAPKKAAKPTESPEQPELTRSGEVVSGGVVGKVQKFLAMIEDDMHVSADGIAYAKRLICDRFGCADIQELPEDKEAMIELFIRKQCMEELRLENFLPQQR